MTDRERSRVEALRRYQILDTAADRAFDDLSSLAAQICGTPVALVSLVDEERQWFKSRHGFEAESTPRSISFCSVAIEQPAGLFVVEDAATDPRFRDNPLVAGEPGIRFYAGAPLVDRDGFALGSLCVIDFEPRRLSEAQRSQLELLARQVVAQIELHRANLELRRAGEIRDRLTAVLAHDLRNPLAAVIAGLDVMQRGNLDEEHRRMLRRIGRSAARMNRLVAEVLDYVQANRLGRLPISLSDADMAELAREVVSDFQLAHPERVFALRVEGDARGRWDVDRFSRVLSNLIGNAHRYGAPETPITIEVRAHGGELCIEVHNRGPAISAEQQERLFQPFSRGDGEAGGDGTGLGLFIVRHIAEAHGGRAEVRSSPEDGTTFSIRVPRAT